MIEGCILLMSGDYNVFNVLSVVVVVCYLGMKLDEICEVLVKFGGVNCCFIKVGEVDGIMIIDDYGYYFVEIVVVLKVVCQVSEGCVIVVY